MVIKVSNYHDAYDFEFTTRTGQSVEETDYIKLLLQTPFSHLKFNIFLFINNYPINYSEQNVKKFLSYLSSDEISLWDSMLDKAFKTGLDFDSKIGNFKISGLSIGKAYIITVDNNYEQDNQKFLRENLKSLGERAKKYKEYCDLIQDPFWIRDRNINLIFVNQAFLDIVECHNIDSVIQKKLWICDKAKSDILAQLALQKNDVQTMNVTYVKDGKPFFGSITETPVFNDDGDIFLFGRLYDKTAENDLKTKVSYLEAGIREILENISVAASLFDNNRRLRFYNKSFVNLWGLTPDYLDTAPDHLDILDKLYANRLIPESRDYKSWRNEVLAPYRDIRCHYEDIWYTPQQKTIKCSISAYLDGGVVCLQENVTDFVALEQSHNILANNLLNTLNALDEGIILCDSYGKIKVSNSKITEIFNQQITVGSHLATLMDSSKENYNLITFIKIIYSFIQDGFPLEQKYTQECFVKDSIFITSVVRLSTSDILIHIRDQTAILNYQKMLYDKTEILKENEHIRESFFRRISHNLRDPMTAIAGFTELLQTEIFGSLNQKQHEYIADMRYSIDDLLRLTDNLADLIRLDSNVITQFENVSLRVILNNAIQSVQNEAFSRKINISRSIDYDAIIKCDVALLKQCFIQILENAITITPHGGEVAVNIIGNNDKLIINIIDHGFGMHISLMEAINNQKINDISGYGLRYILRVIKLHDAHCQAQLIYNENQEICGTCFSITFNLNSHDDIQNTP